MEHAKLIYTLNLTEGEVLTLERAADRVEFEALPMAGFNVGSCSGINCNCDGSKCGCNGNNCGIDLSL